MGSAIKDCIEYSGIVTEEERPCLPSQSSFKQINIQQDLIMPENKPALKEIIKVANKVIIRGTTIQKTLKVVQLDGRKFTGNRVMVEGQIKLQIKYVGDSSDRALYVQKFDVPFSTYIMLPETFIEGEILQVHNYVLDHRIMKINEKSIFSTMMLLLVAEGH